MVIFRFFYLIVPVVFACSCGGQSLKQSFQSVFPKENIDQLDFNQEMSERASARSSKIQQWFDQTKSVELNAEQLDSARQKFQQIDSEIASFLNKATEAEVRRFSHIKGADYYLTNVFKVHVYFMFLAQYFDDQEAYQDNISSDPATFYGLELKYSDLSFLVKDEQGLIAELNRQLREFTSLFIKKQAIQDKEHEVAEREVRENLRKAQEVERKIAELESETISFSKTKFTTLVNRCKSGPFLSEMLTAVNQMELMGQRHEHHDELKAKGEFFNSFGCKCTVIENMDDVGYLRLYSILAGERQYDLGNNAGGMNLVTEIALKLGKCAVYAEMLYARDKTGIDFGVK